MNYENSETASQRSKPIWLRRTRTFIATQLLRCGVRLGLGLSIVAVLIAPWIDDERE